MSGITLTPAQQQTMTNSWTTIKPAWDALGVRLRRGDRLSTADRSAIKALLDQHNAVVRSALTPSQREQLEANLRELDRRRRAAIRASTDSAAAMSGGQR